MILTNNHKMLKHVSNVPHADFLMGSMRSLGYTFESAIADVIDNSISAYAGNIHIKFPAVPSEPCYVSILDDGTGLDNESLLEAMRYGSYSSEAVRDKNDLGRFGLGLKAASLSQCKNLTVASKKDGTISAYRWDYDYVLREKEWYVIELSGEEINKLPEIDELKKKESGTLVIWTEFDILQKSHGDVFSTLKDYRVKLVDYLSLIFHRYLNGDAPHKIEITINNFRLQATDPFLENHKKTNQRQEFHLSIKDTEGIEQYVRVTPFILPFQKDLSKEDIKMIGGIENLKTKQGFYIYRNCRLIIWGTWFRLRKHELTKNARIRVDIPNSLDDIWNIDIKKQNASIPKQIENQLIRAVKEVIELATGQHTYRGRVNKKNQETDYIWNRIEGREKKYYYTINRDSRIFKLLKTDIPDEYMERFNMVLQEIERNIPYAQMYLDSARNEIDNDQDAERLKDIEHKGILLITEMLSLNESLQPGEMIEKLFHSEPFCNHPNLKKNISGYFNL